GKLKGIACAPGEQLWSFLIRQDWLDNLGLYMPTTAEELLDVMRAFTFDDPDGNGKDDTYGFTAAGGGTVGDL
ncbi:sugar ABC transporter substrate-binding protein, partial [Extibacter sp. GGCC_0201]|nr:sugar ABC transporter substrate-binding protein [Extibacter sp. GGCC_0201]